MPIFYQVDPSDVRNQKGTYKKAFEEHLKKNPEKVKEWRQALFETGSLAGWDSSNYRDEAELIQNIVNDIINKLNRGSSRSLSENIVGIDENLDHIELLLEEFSTIGIWGMGGVGKTTMAKVVFSKLCSQFDSCCFLENFSEKYKIGGGIENVRGELLSKLSKNTISLERLGRRKVLIVLDDVSSIRQANDLENEALHLGRGSKIIITSRDKRVLEGRVQKIYKAKALSHDNSLKLFNLKAFRKDGCRSEYQELVKRAVAYAQGNPLALTVLGSHLYSRTVEEWEDALIKIEATAHQEIQAVLKLSYDGLDDAEKEIFLDVACFLKGKSRECVIATLESYDFHASIGLGVLVDKALISLDPGVVRMHDLIQSMAFEIIRQECIKNPGGRSRLWNPDEIYDVLKNNQGTDSIQGISLDLSQIRDLELSADVFKKMPNLRFLQFYYSRGYERSCTVNLTSRLKSLPNSLRWLQWDNFPSKCLPSSFCAEKLAELRMRDSHLKKLWDGVQNLVNLREIDLARSKQLMKLPDFSAAQKLEKVNLQYCESLVHFHPSILSLPRLRDVDLHYCRNLRSLKSKGPSESLLYLEVYGCSSLKKISFSSSKMTSLNLEGTRVKILDFSMGRMEKLEFLGLNGSTLKNLPINDICYMRSLRGLYLWDCRGIIDKSKLHTLFDALLSLRKIDLSGTCKLTELPNNIKHLSRLRHLNVSRCKDLQSLPELPSSIIELDASKCTSLKTLKFTSHIESSSKLCSSVNYLGNLKGLTLGDCEQLYELPEEIGSLSSLSSLDLSRTNVESLPASIKHLSNLERINLRNCRRLRSLPELPPFCERINAEGCISLEKHVMESAYVSLRRLAYAQKDGSIRYPGRKAPEWFTFNQVVEASKNITIELPFPTSNLIGFIFCAVISQASAARFSCELYVVDDRPWLTSCFGNMPSLDSHVLLWCHPYTFWRFHNKTDAQNANYRFEFSFTANSGDADGLIEACGVRPIYASEYPNFIQQMELQSNLGTQKETCHDADENSFHEILKCGNFEGSIIPEWFTHRSSTIYCEFSQATISVQFALDFDNLMGFIFCFVIPQFSSKERDECQSSCSFSLYDANVLSDRRKYWHRPRSRQYWFRSDGPLGWHYSMVKLDSDDDVFLWYDPLYCELVLQQLRQRGKGHDEELEFSFCFDDYYAKNRDSGERNLIKECGVRPIYASEYTNFLLQQNKLRGSTQTKRHRNVDDNQHQLPSTKEIERLFTHSFCSPAVYCMCNKRSYNSARTSISM